MSSGAEISSIQALVAIRVICLGHLTDRLKTRYQQNGFSGDRRSRQPGTSEHSA